MVARGAVASDDELKIVVDYLAAFNIPDSQKMNPDKHQRQQGFLNSPH
jgi:hypothetical protein